MSMGSAKDDPVIKMAKMEPEILQPDKFSPDNDPFRVRLLFTSAEKVQMVLVLIFIVPVRLLVAFISLGKRSLLNGLVTVQLGMVTGVRYCQMTKVRHSFFSRIRFVLATPIQKILELCLNSESM